MGICFEENKELGSWWNPFDSETSDLFYDPEEQITPHFKLKEFLTTSAPVENNPDESDIINIRDMAQRLETYLRPFTGPINILSGFRSQAVNDYLAQTNTSVSNTSLHMQGRAADVTFTNKTPQEVFVYLAQNPNIAKQFGEIAVKRNAMHISSPAPELNKIAAFMDAYTTPYIRLAQEQIDNLVKKWGTPTVIAAGAGGILIALGLITGTGFLIYKYGVKHGR